MKVVKKCSEYLRNNSSAEIRKLRNSLESKTEESYQFMSPKPDSVAIIEPAVFLRGIYVYLSKPRNITESRWCCFWPRKVQVSYTPLQIALAKEVRGVKQEENEPTYVVELRKTAAKIVGSRPTHDKTAERVQKDLYHERKLERKLEKTIQAIQASKEIKIQRLIPRR